jgi:hypothetical protein
MYLQLSLGCKPNFWLAGGGGRGGARTEQLTAQLQLERRNEKLV